MLVSLNSLTPKMQDVLRALVREITAHDGVSPVNESGALGIEGRREADFFFYGTRSEPRGFVVCDERDGTLLLGVHPDHRRHGVGTALAEEALRAHPDSSVWAFGTLPGAVALAARVKLEPVRELLRMERPLGATPPPEGLEGFEVTSYTPGDAESVVALNAEAFAHHQEQGRLTVAEFLDLTRQPWFDPDGLFLAKKDGRLAGFHWTKRHGAGLGEVYVIAVAPEFEGQGLGRVLLQAGLAHLYAAGDDRMQLYVEGDQERVVRMYLNAGFTVAQTDTGYRLRSS